MEQLKGLLILYGAILVFNVLITAFLWKTVGGRLYKTLCMSFLGYAFGFIVQGIASTQGFLERTLAFSCIFFGTLMLSELMAQIKNFSLPLLKLGLIHLVGIGLSLMLFQTDINVPLKALPAVFTADLPLFYVFYAIVRHHRQGLTIMEKCMMSALLITGIHGVDYAWAMTLPEFQVAGFTLAIIVAFATTMFSFGSIMETLTKKATQAKLEMQYGTKLANSSRLAALGEMAGGVAHEINNPLAILLLLAKTINKETPKEQINKDHIKAESDRLIKTAQRISSVVSNLMAFSKDGSKDPIRPESIGDLIDKALDLCRTKLSEDGIELKVDLPETDVKIQCRAVEITQILLNLINNSKDAIIQQSEKWINIKVVPNGSRVEVIITDSGSGISADIKEKIFNPFFTTKEIGKGSGMGLSVAKGLAETNGGTLNLNPTSKNTQFILALNS